MKATIAALALSFASSQAFDPKARILALERALQQGPPDNANENAANVTLGSDGKVTVITGSGVEDAELPSEGGGVTDTIEVPNYTEDECTIWLNKAFGADNDGSNGLGEGEFQDFLLSIEEPPYVAEYFQQFKGPYGKMPWMFKVVHKTLACRCQDLGLGDQCCEGDDAQVPFIGLRDEPELIAALTPAQREIASEYRADMCNSIAVAIQKFIPVPSPTKSPSPAPTLAPVTPPPTVGEALNVGYTEVIPESGTVFECADEDDCNSNVPSLDESSGWTSVGYCGDGTDMNDCPAQHDEDEYYSEGQQVTLVGLPEDGVVFACIDDDACNENDPSLDPASGWESQGDCGEDTPVVCPEFYDSNEDYDEGDTVTLLPGAVKAAPLVIDVLGSVVDYRTFDAEAGDTYYDAENVMLNVANNGVLTEVMSGFGKLSVSVMEAFGDSITSEGKKKRNLRIKNGFRELQLTKPTMGTLDPVIVTDVECPEGLMYAPEKGYCLNFQFKILPDNALAQNQAMSDNFVAMMKMRINEIGDLYDNVYEANPDTIIMGLGNPGKGIDYLYEEPVGVKSTPESTSSGLSVGAIVGIILAIVLIPIALIAMYARHKRQQEKERLRRLAEYENAKRDIEAVPPEVPEEPEFVPEPEPEQEPDMGAGPDEDEESDEPSVWSESSEESGFDEEDAIVENEDNAVPEATTGSALAAMGTIGAVVSLSPDKIQGSSSDEESVDSANIRKEVAALVEETNSPRSAEELLDAYAGREDVLLAHLRKMKSAKSEEPVPVATPTRSVVSPEDAASPVSPSNIDEELLSRMESRKSGSAGAAVATKMQETQESPARAAMTPDDKAKSTKGIDQELLSRMEARSKSSEGLATLAAPVQEKKKTPAPSSSTKFVDKELATRMEHNKEKESLRDEVVELVEATKPGKSADELLRAYKGREKDLIHSLKKLKSVKENKGKKSPEK